MAQNNKAGPVEEPGHKNPAEKPVNKSWLSMSRKGKAPEVPKVVPQNEPQLQAPESKPEQSAKRWPKPGPEKPSHPLRVEKTAYGKRQAQKPRPEANANPAALEVWDGYGWLAGFDKGKLHVKHSLATGLVSLLNSKRDKNGGKLSSSCVWLTLAALAPTVDALAWLEAKRWGVVLLPNFLGTIRVFADKFNLRVHFHECFRQGDEWVLEHRFDIGSKENENHRNMMMVMQDEDYHHLLPLAWPNLEARIPVRTPVPGDLALAEALEAALESPEKPNGANSGGGDGCKPEATEPSGVDPTEPSGDDPTNQRVQPALPEGADAALALGFKLQELIGQKDDCPEKTVIPAPVDRVDVATSSNEIAPEPKCVGPLVWHESALTQQGYLVCAYINGSDDDYAEPRGAEFLRPHQRTQRENRCFLLQGLTMAQSQAQEEEARQYAAEMAELQEDTFVFLQQPEHTKPHRRQWRYYGELPPPTADYNWVGGWWSSVAPKAINLSLFTNVRKPDVCFASLDNARWYADKVSYVFVEARSPAWELRDRLITDGVEQLQTFKPGDVLDIGKLQYLAVATVTKYGEEQISLRLARGKFLDRAWKKLTGFTDPYLGSARTARALQMGAPELPVVAKTKANWQGVTLTAKEPLPIAMLSLMRQNCAAANYDEEECPAPRDAERFVRSLAKSFATPVGVGGRYAWGYCYSCGASLPGTFKQRLCKSSCAKRVNTSLGNMVAEGLQVCNPVAPIVYPGVVWTKSRHPPLKDGSKTLATEQCFRLSPVALRLHSASPPSSASGRAWVGWA